MSLNTTVRGTPMLRLGWFGRNRVLALSNLHLSSIAVNPRTREVKFWQGLFGIILPYMPTHKGKTRARVICCECVSSMPFCAVLGPYTDLAPPACRGSNSLVTMHAGHPSIYKVVCSTHTVLASSAAVRVLSTYVKECEQTNFNHVSVAESDHG